MNRALALLMFAALAGGLEPAPWMPPRRPLPPEPPPPEPLPKWLTARGRALDAAEAKRARRRERNLRNEGGRR